MLDSIIGAEFGETRSKKMEHSSTCYMFHLFEQNIACSEVDRLLKINATKIKANHHAGPGRAAWAECCISKHIRCSSMPDPIEMHCPHKMPGKSSVY